MIILDDRTRIVASSSSWIEGEAQRQLLATSALPAMRWAVGLPDLHPGKGHPVGVAALADGVIYPHLVGGDIGCGMALLRTDLDARAARPDRLAKRLQGLEGRWTGDGAEWLRERGIDDAVHLPSLGTIGGGNHFAELQALDAIEDPTRVAALWA